MVILPEGWTLEWDEYEKVFYLYSPTEGWVATFEPTWVKEEDY